MGRAAVAPYVGAWIETRHLLRQRDTSVSHPMWVRGLKHRPRARHLSTATSHPMWVRGLKHADEHGQAGYTNVAPYVGAWIETFLSISKIRATDSRTLCGCVD